jgi:predicted permease
MRRISLPSSFALIGGSLLLWAFLPLVLFSDKIPSGSEKDWVDWGAVSLSSGFFLAAILLFFQKAVDKPKTRCFILSQGSKATVPTSSSGRSWWTLRQERKSSALGKSG